MTLTDRLTSHPVNPVEAQVHRLPKTLQNLKKKDDLRPIWPKTIENVPILRLFYADGGGFGPSAIGVRVVKTDGHAVYGWRGSATGWLDTPKVNRKDRPYNNDVTLILCANL